MGVGLAGHRVDGTALMAKYRLCVRLCCLGPSKEPDLGSSVRAGNHCQLHSSLEGSVLAAETEVDTAHNLSARGQSLVPELKPTSVAGCSLELSLLPLRGSDSADWKAESLFPFQPDQFFIAKRNCGIVLSVRTCSDVALLVSDSFVVRTLKALLLCSQGSSLDSASLFPTVCVETEDCSERGGPFALFLLEASGGFVVLFCSRSLLK